MIYKEIRAKAKSTIIALSIGFFLCAASSKGYSGDQNLITNEYAPGWFSTPFGFGEWVKNPDDSKVDILKLRAIGPGSSWMIGLLPFLSGQFYEMSVTLKAPVGVAYRYYVACNGKDGQQSAGSNGVGTGEWQTVKKAFSFKDFLKDQAIEKGMVAVSLESGGELLISNVTILETVDWQQKAVDALEKSGEVLMIAEGEDEPWTFVGNDLTVGKWVPSKNGKGVPVLKIESGDNNATYWSRGNLPIKSNVGYVCTYKVKAERGVKYQVYLENNTDGRWQNFSAGVQVGTGRWEETECPVYFTDISTDPYVVMRALSPGTVDFSEFTIKRDERAVKAVTKH